MGPSGVRDRGDGRGSRIRTATHAHPCACCSHRAGYRNGLANLKELKEISGRKLGRIDRLSRMSRGTPVRPRILT